MLTTPPEFKANARHALADASLEKALAFSKPQFMARRSAAVDNLPEFERLRDVGRDIKNHALANLDFYLETFEANVQRAGGRTYGWVYPGPMGSVLTPSLIGVDKAGHLPNASAFCAPSGTTRKAAASCLAASCS